jgi:crotonobetainyl-CoA:carnitine CoA-transferase CaiB-like acyl-CoA transferase
MDASVPSPSLGFPLKFDPPLQTREAQDWRLGAHTVEVLTELGWSREGIAAARASGAIEAVDS